MFISLAAALAIPVPTTSTPVLLDGRCDDAAYSLSSPVDLGEGATLFVAEDAHSLSICVKLPPNSLGTSDLIIADPLTGLQTNLHISASVGEWPLPQDENAQIDWGNHVGWYGPPVEFEGMETREDGSRRPRFREQKGREFQLLKSRFGEGPWAIRLEVRRVGESHATVRWPLEPDSWGNLEPKCDMSNGTKPR